MRTKCKYQSPVMIEVDIKQNVSLLSGSSLSSNGLSSTFMHAPTVTENEEMENEFTLPFN